MGMPAKKLQGQRFGKWPVLRQIGKKKGEILWLCRCDCGKRRKKTSAVLRNAKGCQICMGRARSIGGPIRTKGGKNTPEYAAYHTARSKCTNPKDSHWRYYGGRGIKFLFESFEQFYAELGPRPSKKYSVDRKENSGNYAPGNVRWATSSMQAKNRRKTLSISMFPTQDLVEELKRRNEWPK